METIACPKCGQKIQVFLMESAYHGPLKCANCRGLFKVSIESGKVKSWEPMSEEELKAAQEVEKLKAKFRRGPAAD